MLAARGAELFPKLPPPAVTFYNVADANADARPFLASHRERTRAQHIFGDVFERLSWAAQRAIERRALTLWSDSKVEHREQQLGDDVLERWRSNLTSEYVRDLQIELEESVWCHTHERRCSVVVNMDQKGRHAGDGAQGKYGVQTSKCPVKHGWNDAVAAGPLLGMGLWARGPGERGGPGVGRLDAAPACRPDLLRRSCAAVGAGLAPGPSSPAAGHGQTWRRPEQAARRMSVGRQTWRRR